MPTVHAIETIVVVLPDGTARTVRKDQGFEQDDAVVQAHPWLFGLKRTKVRGRVVEQATAAPGELRNL